LVSRGAGWSGESSAFPTLELHRRERRAEAGQLRGRIVEFAPLVIGADDEHPHVTLARRQHRRSAQFVHEIPNRRYFIAANLRAGDPARNCGQKGARIAESGTVPNRDPSTRRSRCSIYHSTRTWLPAFRMPSESQTWLKVGAAGSIARCWRRARLKRRSVRLFGRAR